MRLAVDDGRGHAVCLDLPPNQGNDLGPTALELCVMSHVGCYATIFLLTARKSRISVKDLEIKTKSIKSEEAGTITEEAFNIAVKTDAPRDRIQRIHKLTLLGCPVGILFEKAGVKTTYNLRTEKG